MKKLDKKKNSPNQFTLLSVAVLFVIGVVVTGFTQQKQEVRSRAADDQMQYVTATSANTGSAKPATSITIPAPGGAQVGDVLVAILQADYGHIGGGLPAGWTLITERNENDDLAEHAYYKVVTGSEPANYTWNIILSGKNEALAGGTVMLFRGVSTTHPVVDQVVNPETEDGTKSECPSVLAPTGGMLICGWTNDDPVKDIKVPDSMKRVSYFTIRDNDAHAVAYEAIPNEGQTGTRVADLDLTNVDVGKGNNDIAIGITLLPKNGVIPNLSPTMTPQPSSFAIKGPDPASTSATPTPDPKSSTSDKNFLIQFLESLLQLLRHFI